MPRLTLQNAALLAAAGVGSQVAFGLLGAILYVDIWAQSLRDASILGAVTLPVGFIAGLTGFAFYALLARALRSPESPLPRRAALIAAAASLLSLSVSVCARFMHGHPDLLSGWWYWVMWIRAVTQQAAEIAFLFIVWKAVAPLVNRVTRAVALVSFALGTFGFVEGAYYHYRSVAAAWTGRLWIVWDTHPMRGLWELLRVAGQPVIYLFGALSMVVFFLVVWIYRPAPDTGHAI